MCARRFLLLIFWLTLIVVAAAFAIFQYGQQALIRGAIPKGHYVAPPPRDGPDYSEAANWIARADVLDNPSEWNPIPRYIAYGRASPPAAIFFIHPTTYLKRDRWNAPIKGDAESDRRAEMFVRSQSSALTSAGRVWAPRYRQAAFGAFLLDDEDARAALALAYADVERAFDRFLAEIPPDQAIILAGHSQGSLHLSRLMRERVAGKPIARRIIAAYVVGWPLSLKADIPLMGLPACRRADDSGCILSWQSFAEPSNASLILDVYEGSVGPNGVKRRRADMLCVNPITGTIGGRAAPAANGWTLVPNADLSDAKVEAQLVGAGCDDGFLILEGPPPALGPYVLPGNNYHVYDYALFWGAIRDDAQKRLWAFERRR